MHSIRSETSCQTNDENEDIFSQHRHNPIMPDMLWTLFQAKRYRILRSAWTQNGGNENEKKKKTHTTQRIRRAKITNNTTHLSLSLSVTHAHTLTLFTRSRCIVKPIRAAGIRQIYPKSQPNTKEPSRNILHLDVCEFHSNEDDGIDEKKSNRNRCVWFFLSTISFAYGYIFSFRFFTRSRNWFDRTITARSVVSLRRQKVRQPLTNQVQAIWKILGPPLNHLSHSFGWGKWRRVKSVYFALHMWQFVRNFSRLPSVCYTYIFYALFRWIRLAEPDINCDRMTQKWELKTWWMYSINATYGQTETSTEFGISDAVRAQHIYSVYVVQYVEFSWCESYREKKNVVLSSPSSL